MLGRLLGGTATSILYSAFESWLVNEHNKVSTQYFSQYWFPFTEDKKIDCSKSKVFADDKTNMNEI